MVLKRQELYLQSNSRELNLLPRPVPGTWEGEEPLGIIYVEYCFYLSIYIILPFTPPLYLPPFHSSLPSFFVLSSFIEHLLYTKL